MKEIPITSSLRTNKTSKDIKDAHNQEHYHVYLPWSGLLKFANSLMLERNL